MSGNQAGIVSQAATAEESSEEESSEEEDDSDEEMAEPAKPASNKRKAAEVHNPFHACLSNACLSCRCLTDHLSGEI